MTTPTITHITGQGTAATGYSIRIHQAGRDVITRRDQLDALTDDQRTLIARRLKGVGGKRQPRLDSAVIWRALDRLEAFRADRGAITVTADLDPEERSARAFAGALEAVGRHGLSAALG